MRIVLQRPWRVMPWRVPPSVFPGFHCTLVTCVQENSSPRLSLMTTTSKSPSKPAEATTSTRRWHRFRFDVPVRAILQRGARELQLAGRGTGMNEGGIGLDVEAPVQLGDQVQVEFTPPYSGIKLRVRGMVRNVAGNRAGIEFLAADEGERQEVALFRRMLRAAADRLGE